MSEVTSVRVTASAPALKYERPTITVVTEEEVLRAFQMTAAQIGAAAVWWSATCSAC
jgi:hypothetical protein